MRVVARTLSWLLVLSSSTAIAQGPAAGTAAQDRPPDAQTPIRGVKPTGMKILTHYSEGVLGPHEREPSERHASYVSRLARRQDLTTTQRYMHLSPAALDSAIRLLDCPGVLPHFGDISNDVGSVKGHLLRSGRRSRRS